MVSRPGEVDSDQIETLTESNQHYTMLEIAESIVIQINSCWLLKMSKSIVIGENKKISLILWENPHRLFGQPIVYF